MQKNFVLKKIAVLGAGVMGGQIAAHCVNAGFETLLFDLETEGKNSNAIAALAIGRLAQLNPTPLATPETASLLTPCNYANHLALLASCDLIIEVIAERLDWKESLYQRISPHLGPNAILVTNTSGLSVNALALALPKAQRGNFCGVHFFNPPRYMHLVELIPAEATSAQLLDKLESWLTRYLGKGVVRAKDTPNFIANRIGVFSLLVTLHYANKFKIGLDEVDALTGPLIGRPKSATCRTMDVVGLDTMQHVVRTMQEQLPTDPWHALFDLPPWLKTLIDQGHLGQKTGQGIYRKKNQVIEVYDTILAQYRPAEANVAEELSVILSIQDPRQRMHQLAQCAHPQAQFLIACWRDLLHYSVFHLAEIADTIRDVDLAMQWGFGWQQGPFATWQAAGMKKIYKLIDNAIITGNTFSDVPMPRWLNALEQFYHADEAWSPSAGQFKPTSNLAVYRRQTHPTHRFKTSFEHYGVCVSELADDILLLTFTTKANTISRAVIDGMAMGLERAQQQAQGLIIYQYDANDFSSGADLRGVAELIQANKFAELASMVSDFQQLLMRLKYSFIPTIAATRGRALGGGCELMMHCSAIVAAFETYPGLVEMGVGLIPAGGGCKEMALRASHADELMMPVRRYFEQIAKAEVASSAPNARLRGYLRPTDHWVMHQDEVLNAAIAKVHALQAHNYLPPIPRQFKVAGLEGHAQLQVGLVNWLEGGFMSQHDYFIASQLAEVMCGGAVYQDTLVDEAWLLELEKTAFIRLAEHPLTQARIMHLLKTGKPLRN